MLRGIYASASSLAALMRRQEAMSHNLANLSTPGFKQEVVIAQEGAGLRVVEDFGAGRQSAAIGPLHLNVNGGETVVDYSQGPLDNTTRPLDLAIAGDGFFRVQTPDGVRLTRDGAFHRDSAGNLVTADGYAVLGDNGPIHIGADDPYIAGDGSVFLPTADAPVARLSLARVADPTTLRVQADNLLDPGAAAVQLLPAADTSIKQGFVEQANVDLSGTVVNMMMALRSYEATERSLRMQDDALQRGLEIGRV